MNAGGRLCTFVGLLCPALACFAATPDPQLHIDPFERPALAGVSLKPANNTDPRRESWQPKLRATMRWPDGSMVNLEGRLVTLGEDIDGFRLIEVRERSAVFVKNGLTYPLTMDNGYENNEAP